jgi:glycosyltransferase involved in cell wall biosynthesis
VAVIYDRLNYLTLGSVIALLKDKVDSVYVVDGNDKRISGIARSLGASVVERADFKGIGKTLPDSVFVFLYGDGTNDPEKVPELLAGICEGNDLVLAPANQGALSRVSESVQYFSDKRFRSGFSGFLACSPKCLAGLSADGQESPAKQVFTFARSSGLRVLKPDGEGESFEMLSLYRIGVVVPAYNEEHLIAPTIAGIPSYVSKIYVVDDCSTDSMPEIVKGIVDPRVVYIRHEVNKGVGAAIVTGYKRALGDDMDIVAVMAGDNQMDPEQLPRLLMPIIDGKADYAKGNRLMSKELRKGMSAWRSLGNFMLTMVTKVGSGYWHITDPQNGYTAISREALESIDLDSVYTYYGYCNDLLIKMNALGMRAVDVVMPARYGEEKSKIKYSRFILKVAPMIFRGFLWRLKTKYIMLDFNILVLFYIAGMTLIPAGAALVLWMLFQMLSGNVVSSVYRLFTVFIIIWGVQFLLFAMMLDVQENKSVKVISNDMAR